MTKSETMKQLAAASNAGRLDDLGQRIETLRSARIESAEQLAAMLEPLAQAMAALTDET
jgi:malate synthase